MKAKRIEPIVDYGIRFTEEELDELGLETGQNVFITPNENGSITLSKGEKIEIDFSEYTKGELLNILYCIGQRDITLSEYVTEALEWGIKFHKKIDPEDEPFYNVPPDSKEKE